MSKQHRTRSQTRTVVAAPAITKFVPHHDDDLESVADDAPAVIDHADVVAGVTVTPAQQASFTALIDDLAAKAKQESDTAQRELQAQHDTAVASVAAQHAIDIGHSASANEMLVQQVNARALEVAALKRELADAAMVRQDAEEVQRRALDGATHTQAESARALESATRRAAEIEAARASDASMHQAALLSLELTMAERERHNADRVVRIGERESRMRDMEDSLDARMEKREAMLQDQAKEYSDLLVQVKRDGAEVAEHLDVAHRHALEARDSRDKAALALVDAESIRTSAEEAHALLSVRAAEPVVAATVVAAPLAATPVVLATIVPAPVPVLATVITPAIVVVSEEAHAHAKLMRQLRTRYKSLQSAAPELDMMAFDDWIATKPSMDALMLADELKTLRNISRSRMLALQQVPRELFELLDAHVVEAYRADASRTHALLRRHMSVLPVLVDAASNDGNEDVRRRDAADAAYAVLLNRTVDDRNAAMSESEVERESRANTLSAHAADDDASSEARARMSQLRALYMLYDQRVRRTGAPRIARFHQFLQPNFVPSSAEQFEIARNYLVRMTPSSAHAAVAQSNAAASTAAPVLTTHQHMSACGLVCADATCGSFSEPTTACMQVDAHGDLCASRYCSHACKTRDARMHVHMPVVHHV